MIDGYTDNEELIGDYNNQLFLKRKLNIERMNYLKAFKGYKSLYAISRSNNYFDMDFFLEKLNLAKLLISSTFKTFKLIPFERYLVYFKENNDLGGFYDSKAGGFHYITLVGFSTLLNNQRINCSKLIAIELLRNYIHDCFHFSTYRSFKVTSKGNDGKEFYRYQYGFNFRNEFGISYSDSRLTSISPKAINLNLLMEGVTAIYTSNVMSSLSCEKDFILLNPINFQIYNDIINLKITDFKILDNLPLQFYNEILLPCKIFIEHWGGCPFIYTCINAMLKGDFNLIKNYFDYKSGEKNYIDKHFKQKKFNF
ncbi:MAG: hypothetical protein ACK5M1_07175 [Xanthomarina gelatinilytica]|uniref:hypothetical protein n=1 Tax=Xanthomarina gelatinilytica TaxID=1137281 RepID=UPI003A871C2A